MRLGVQAATFLAWMIASTMVCAVVWECRVTDTAYNCTDSVGPDFILPSRHWVHNPVTVQRVVAGRPMSEPDTIRVGWTVAGLERLRWSFVAASVALSSLLTWLVCTLFRDSDWFYGRNA